MSTAALASARPKGGDAIRSALVEAAGRLLGELGPRTVSVRDIARRAGVNHGQVHHYFGGKRGVLEAAMKKLAIDHHARAMALSGGSPVPPVLSLAEDRDYWRAVCQVVMDGDLALARIEVDEEVSVPRQALAALQEREGVAHDDLDFKALFAAIVALHLGFIAFEPFVRLVSDVDDPDAEALRTRIKDIVQSIIGERVPRTGGARGALP